MAEDVYAVPDLTKKVRYGRRERQQEKEERGEREERMVDIYVSADDLDPDPGTQQDAVQQNTAQQQHGASGELKKTNGSRAAAVCLGLLGLLCVILLAVIIVLAKHNSEKNNLVYNITAERDELQIRYNNITAERDELQTRYNNITAERDELKKRLCESCGWKLFGGGCYYISTERKTWEQSRQDCRDKQSDLIIINSNEEQDFVNTVVDRYLGVWLGLTDREEEGVWKWVDGTPVTVTTPTYWRSGEPNGHYGEDCAVLYYDRWNDNACSYLSRWICERVI